MMKKRILGMAAAAVLAAGSANASLVMYLDDTSTAGIDVIVVDNFDGGVGTATAVGASNAVDGLADDGGILFVGNVGNFLVNVSTGTSNPLLSLPKLLDLNSVNVSGVNAGTLVIGLTDTDYINDGNLSFAIGGVAGNDITAKAWADAGNGEFAMTTLLADMNFGVGAFSDTSAGTDFSGITPFSLTIETTVTHTAAGQATSYNAAVSVPEPSIIALFGLGLAGIGFAGRRRKAK